MTPSIVASLDTETTGLNEPEHRIIEVHIDLLNIPERKKIFSFTKRINPLRAITAEAQRVHGISFSDVANEPPWEVIGPQVYAVLSKAQMQVAHNIEFDGEFLDREFARIGLPALTQPRFCTMENGIWATPNGKKPSLKELCFACEVPYDETLSHAADYDVGVMNECFFRGLDWGFYTLPELEAPNVLQAA